MTTAPSTRQNTFIHELMRALDRAGEYNAHDQAPPAVIQWTNKDRQEDWTAASFLSAKRGGLGLAFAADSAT